MKRLALAVLVSIISVTTAVASHAEVRKDCSVLRASGLNFVGQYQSKLWFAGEHNSANGHISNFVVNEADHYVTYKLIGDFDRSYEKLLTDRNVTTDQCYSLVYSFAKEAAEYLDQVTNTGELPFTINW